MTPGGDVRKDGGLLTPRPTDSAVQAAIPSPGAESPRRRKQDVMDLILDTAMDDPGWDRVLELLCGRISAYQALIEVHLLFPPKCLFLAAHGVEPLHRDRYISQSAQRNPWLKVWSSSFTPGSIVSGDRLFSRLDLQKTEFYRDFILPQELLYLVGVTLLNDDRGLVTIMFFRPRTAGPFHSGEISELKTFIPALQQAMDARRRIREAEQNGRTAREILDLFPVGALFLDVSGGVQAMNRKARETLELKDGLRLAAEGLGASSPQWAALLRTALHDALAEVGKPHAVFPKVLTLENRSREGPLHLLLFPVQAPGESIGEPRPMMILLILDPWKAGGPSETTLQDLFGLSKAEARLAAFLASGDSVVEGAKKLGIGPATARTHLKHIFAKTGTSRQGELIRLLLECPAMMTMPGSP